MERSAEVRHLQTGTFRTQQDPSVLMALNPAFKARRGDRADLY